MNEDILHEESIELRPQERIGALLKGDTQREEITEFQEFQLSRENLKSFYYMTKKEYAKDFYLMSFLIDKILEQFKIHPEFNSFFKEAMKDDKKQTIEQSKPYLLTKQEILDNYRELMRLFREFVPLLDIFSTIAIEVPKKLFALNISIVPGIVDQRGRIFRKPKELGQTRGGKAFLSWKAGASYDQVMEEYHFKSVSEAASYVHAGRKQAIAIGIQDVQKNVQDEALSKTGNSD